MDGVVVTINIVTFLLPTPGNFRIKIAEILFNPGTQHACEGQIATRTSFDAIDPVDPLLIDLKRSITLWNDQTAAGLNFCPGKCG
jgi:hypothetical protein